MAWYIFDMDGTLLNDKHHVPTATNKWLVSLKQKGHKLGVATGRPYEGIQKGLAKSFDMFDFIASYNGAMIDYQGKTVKQELLVKEIGKFKSDDYILAISLGADLYTESKERSFDIIKRLEPSNIYPLDELQKDFFAIRIICKNSDQAIKSYNNLVNMGFDRSYNIVMSTGIYILITHKDASKAHAVEYLHKNSNEKIYFFGDSHNDLPVFYLDFVTSVVPKNAVTEIQKNADYVLNTTNNETLKFEPNK